MPLLSVVVPVYNEAKTIKEILQKINSVGIDKEIIVVDNYSTDGTREILLDISKKWEFNTIRVIYHSYNKGKGESVKEGIREASGNLVVIQDADLEYEPQEYVNLMKPILDNKADIVLGARFTVGYSGLRLHRMGNRFLTSFLNFLFSSHLNDYATCYKMSRKDTFMSLNLESSSFDIDVEIVCKALKRSLRINEVPITYSPRSYKEGKKIRLFDAMHAMTSILKYRFTK